VRRLGLWARANPLKIFLMFLTLTFSALTAEQEIGGIGGSVTYFVLMFAAIVLGAAFLRGGKR
jgi:hypothetical protein